MNWKIIYQINIFQSFLRLFPFPLLNLWPYDWVVFHAPMYVFLLGLKESYAILFDKLNTWSWNLHRDRYFTEWTNCFNDIGRYGKYELFCRLKRNFRNQISHHLAGLHFKYHVPGNINCLNGYSIRYQIISVGKR